MRPGSTHAPEGLGCSLIPGLMRECRAYVSRVLTYQAEPDKGDMGGCPVATTPEREVDPMQIRDDWGHRG